uniref:VWFA domain-containing protein n=1 Tax=Kalanchoe fedtschenkoi TaxID=63787 RepID=A0A7N0T9Y0_KALFE
MCYSVKHLNSTSNVQALSGLQFLLNRIQLVQESGSKFPFSDHIKQITGLASSWKKMEFESWHFLIDEVQAECDRNAAKMWFPLYTLLRMRDKSDVDEYVKSTIESLEEFVHMSSIGEFKRRLHLLLAFHVQISRGLLLEFYSSPCEMENLKILYHVLGYYMQFMPVILEHVNTHKTSVQKELDELLKLCKWEHPESYLCVANTKRVRQKLKKLILKYTDVLQQPVMVILKQEEMRRGINTQSSNLSNAHTDISSKNHAVINTPLNLDQFDESRCSWFEAWRQNAQSCWKNMSSDVGTIFESGLASQAGHVVYPEQLNSVWSVLKNLFGTGKGCAELWNDMNTSLGKRRALSEFLKLLEICGLSRHKSMYIEDQHRSNACSQWFLQPSYDTKHLLMKQNDNILNNTSSNKSQVLLATDLVDEWKTANQYHFKSLASVELLRQIRLNFHTDFNLEQVKRSVSYLDHLIIIQQEQRASAYNFAGEVRHLEKSLLILRNLIISSPNSETDWDFAFVPEQQKTLSCMWQQKRIFDHLCSMLGEADSFMKMAESIHLNTCKSVKPWTKRFQIFVQKHLPDCRNSKEMLDSVLLDEERGITAVGVSEQFLSVISKQDLENVVEKNFLTLTMLEENVHAFRGNFDQQVSIEDTMLSHFDDILKEVKSMKEQFQSTVETKQEIAVAADKSYSGNYSELYAKFHGSLKKSLEHAAVTTLALGCSQNDDHLSEESLGNIPSWTALFNSYTSKLQLEGLCDNLLSTVVYAGELVKHGENGSSSLTSELGKKLKMLEQLLDKILQFSDGLLQDFLAMHKTVCALSLFLADLFASLYSKGFGNSEKQEDSCDDTSQDAKGTGMGEGVGAKDVSEQLEDEDQLLGTLEQKEEQDGANEDPGKNDKGIEMEEDFAADTYSVSEDSGEDDDKNDDEDEQLDSAMGDAGTESAVVDEKNWDKNKDEEPDSTEKYETGSSVKDQNTDDRELRGKDDSEDALPNDLSKDLDPAEGDEKNDENVDNGDDLEENENMEDANLDKDEAFAEPTGLDIDENNQELQENMDLDPQEDGADEAENVDEASEDTKDLEETMNETEATLDEGEPEQLGENSEMENVDKGGENDPKMDVDEDVNGQDASDTRSSAQPKFDLQAIGANYAPEVNWSNSSDIQNDPTSAEGLPGTAASENEIMMADASEKGRPTNYKSDMQVSEQNTSKSQKNQPNPFRSVGDALQEWKERAKVSTDIGEGDEGNLDDMAEDEPDEYGYVPESETGTAQALGAATSDQVNKDVNANKADEESIAHNENVSEKESEQKNAENNPVQNGTAVQRNKVQEDPQTTPFEEPIKERSPEVAGENNNSEGFSDSLVTCKRSFMSSGISQLNELSLSDDEPQEAKRSETTLKDTNDEASKQWRRYELRTTRLSQELAEQLRLVMEPTLASKLQGDYKTGKRINMKKVIPYIASQYRKDKIWLRRTRPNKRDYQVVIAVDDSRSMSESSCGDVAIEALVTVCRAMSQLEVGSLAVASFGKKGNVKLLHDFDQPFSGEAGVKMISSFTFEQENTIADEPVVDLLRYLNNMLDNAVANARLPSGQNPLQQLVLIIADGRFHEKAKLRRIVRDAMSRRRLIAFLLLDSPQESIMDLMEVSFEKGDSSSPGGMKMSKYLDSFPFPYYIVLKDIDSLPRTLADLMRQWFELTQLSGD